MKTRLGFVSNSSSSSFTCDISGYTGSGMDLCMSDIGMVECENGHIFEEQFIEDGAMERVKAIYIAEQKKEYADSDWAKDYEDEDWLEDFGYGFPKEACPLCSFHNISKDNFIALVLRDKVQTREEFAKEVKERFTDYEDFQTYVKG